MTCMGLDQILRNETTVVTGLEQCIIIKAFNSSSDLNENKCTLRYT